MTAMPLLGRPRELSLPTVEQREVEGSSLLVARLPTVALVHVRLRLLTRGGAASALLAASLLDMQLDRGTVRERLERHCTSAEVQSDADGVVLTAVAEPAVVADVVDVVLSVRGARPASADVLAAERARLTAVSQTLLSDAGEAARRAALAAAYGTSHPYAEALPTADLLASVDAEDVADELRSAGVASLVVVGDLDAVTTADRVVGALTGASPPSADMTAPQLRPARSWVERHGSVQTALRSVAAAPALGAPDRAAAEVLDMLLGNGWCSVFHRVLREQHGYGYHPSSSIVDHRLGAQLEMSVDVAAEVTGAALAVLEEELVRLATTPVEEELLEIARRSALGELARRFDSQAFLAELLHDLAAAGLPPSYLQQHAEALREVTADEVQSLAARVLRLDAMSLVLVGDRASVIGQQSSDLLDSVL